jgi:hypothetical protein
VFVIDGSFSMGWERKATTPHAAAIGWAHRFLEELRPGDTVALFDAREQARPIIDPPTRDFGFVREQLNKLPPPSGSLNLAEALSRAVNVLSQTDNLSREVIVLTDGQARGWRADDANLWAAFDDLVAQPSVKSRIWVIDVNDQASPQRINFSVERLQLSRELTVAKFPVRIKTKVNYRGGQTAVSRRVYLEVDGQRLSEQTLQVKLQPDGEASVEFEYRFPTVGSHLVSVSVDDDNLPGDNRSDASIRVADALPVLLVDGDPHLDGTTSETYFAVAALTSSLNKTPWVRARVVGSEEFAAQHLASMEVVVLANVDHPTDDQTTALKSYVARGGGLFIALGDKVDPAAYNKSLFESGRGLLPASLETIETDAVEELRGVHVVNSSLELPWMTRFRAEHDGGLTEARFAKWWKVSPATDPLNQSAVERETVESEKGETERLEKETVPFPKTSTAVVAARLETGDPLLITRRYGRGSVMLMTSPLDAAWSTLPAKPDYVALLHELIFHLASEKFTRNVDVGMPLMLPVADDFPYEDYAFYGPDDTEFPATPAGDELRPLVQLSDTRLPGIYSLRRKGNALRGRMRPQYWVVNFDRGESDLTPLDGAQRKKKKKHERMAFVESIDDLKTQMFIDNSRAEFWHILLLIFLAILVGEVAMTRHLVKGGHAVTNDDVTNDEDLEPQMHTDGHR